MVLNATTYGRTGTQELPHPRSQQGYPRPSGNTGSKTNHNHESFVRLAGSQKETISARHYSAADFLTAIQKKTTLAVPCMLLQKCQTGQAHAIPGTP